VGFLPTVSFRNFELSGSTGVLIHPVEHVAQLANSGLRISIPSHNDHSLHKFQQRIPTRQHQPPLTARNRRGAQITRRGRANDRELLIRPPSLIRRSSVKHPSTADVSFAVFIQLPRD